MSSKKIEDAEVVKENVTPTEPSAPIFGMATLKELCPACGREMMGPHLINSIPSQKRAAFLKTMEGTVLGYCVEPCPECQRHMKEGFLFIAVDGEKQEHGIPKRTGHIAVAPKNMVDQLELGQEILDNGFVLLDYAKGKELGIFRDKKETNGKGLDHDIEKDSPIIKSQEA